MQMFDAQGDEVHDGYSLPQADRTALISAGFSDGRDAPPDLRRPMLSNPAGTVQFQLLPMRTLPVLPTPLWFWITSPTVTLLEV